MLSDYRTCLGRVAVGLAHRISHGCDKDRTLVVLGRQSFGANAQTGGSPPYRMISHKRNLVAPIPQGDHRCEKRLEVTTRPCRSDDMDTSHPLKSCT